MSTITNTQPYVPQTTETQTLTFEVYIVNRALSARFAGIMPHFNFVNTEDGVSNNRVVRAKEALSIAFTWEVFHEPLLEPQLLEKEQLLRKRDVFKESIKESLRLFLKPMMNASFVEEFDPEYLRVAIKNTATGPRYNVWYQGTPFAYLTIKKKEEEDES